MPFDRPTLADLIRTKEAEFDSRLPGADARLPASNLNVMARVGAGGEHGLYGYLDYLADQIPVDTAEAEWLDRYGGIWGVVRKPAAAAVGTVLFSGLDGAVIPAGTLLQRGDAAVFVTQAEAEIAAGTAPVEVRALEPGLAGNTSAGGKLKLVSSLSGVRAEAVAAEGLSAGADAEGDEALRARLLSRIQDPPHGGSADDYRRWALEVPGVTRAWVSGREMGAGTVTVRFVMDRSDTIIPTAEEVAAVQAHIDTLRPVTAEVFVVAPIPKPLNLTISLTPGTAAVRAAVADALADLIRREAAPGGTILRSHLTAAVSGAAGETDHRMTVPAGDVLHTAGQIAVPGVIDWS